jgi:uncharacterized membrane protein
MEETEPVSTPETATDTTALVHLYRGELSRSDVWRTRLDTTTNWAITSSAAVISLGISNPQSPHQIFLVGMALVMVFLLLEARRYRYYDLWIHRVRLLERGLLLPALRREPLNEDALHEMALVMARPQLQLSLLSAITTRLHRAYGPVLLMLLLTWLVRLYTHPGGSPPDFHTFVDRARVGGISGYVVLGVVAALALLIAGLLVASLVLRQPEGELRPRPQSRSIPLWERVVRPYAVRGPRHPRPEVRSFQRETRPEPFYKGQA